jgi:hypothetical protein
LNWLNDLVGRLADGLLRRIYRFFPPRFGSDLASL